MPLKKALPTALWIAAATLLPSAAPAADAPSGVHALVDRLSGAIAPPLAAPNTEHPFRALSAPPEGEHVTVTVTAAAAGGCSPEELCKVRLTVAQPGQGPRLLLVDAGAVFRGPAGADLVPVPNQRFVVDKPSMTLEVEALPVWPGKPAPPDGTPLTVAGSNDPGLIAVLRSVQRLESEDAARLRRYVKETDGAFQVETIVDNEDVRAARWMSWSKDAAGQLQGKYPRDAIRFALYAVTAGFTINETADWFRSVKKMEMNPAIAAAGEMSRRVEMVLERGGLNHRVFSPAHADYHLNRGIKAFQANDLDGAEKAFRQAIDRQSGLVEAHYNLGTTLYRKGKYADAESTWQVGTGLPGAAADMFYNRGAVLYRQGDTLGAARMFRKALELNPRDPDAGTWLAKADPEDKTAPKAAPPPVKDKGKKRR